jgi:hypothetical protein
MPNTRRTPTEIEKNDKFTYSSEMQLWSSQ